MALVNVLLLLCLASSGLTFGARSATFDVTKYGAVGDGKTDDSQAFLKAWKATCEASVYNPILNVPEGKEFFLNSLVFEGPCKSSALQVQIDGKLVAPKHKNEWRNCTNNTWLTFRRVSRFYLQGKGTLDGNGAVWWDEKAQSPPEGVCRKPSTLRLTRCSKVHLKGLSFLNSGGSHLKILKSKNIYVVKINITAPEDSPNTDGIDIKNSRKIHIRDSNIKTGDDCIAINTNSFKVNISGINCGPGHGISVGSLGKNGDEAKIDGIYVEYCTFTRTMASTRIKTWVGGSGYARNIFYKHITLNDVKNGIEIYQHYNDNGYNKEKAVELSNIHFVDVRGTGQQVLLDCSEYQPCKQIYLQDVNIGPVKSGQKVTAICNNADVKASNTDPNLKCTNSIGSGISLRNYTDLL